MAASNKRPRGAATSPMAAVALPARATVGETAKREQDRAAANAEFPDVELGRGDWDNVIDERIDVLENEDPWSAQDPVEAAISRVREPGMAYKLLSPRVCGLQGNRGYEVVRDEEGREVTVGNMVLGKIPQRIADARLRKAARESEEAVGALQDKYTDEVDRVNREAGGHVHAISHGQEMTANAGTDGRVAGLSRPSGVDIRRGA